MEWIIWAVFLAIKLFVGLFVWLALALLAGWIMDGLDLPLQVHHTTPAGSFDYRGRRVIVLPSWAILLLMILFAPGIILVGIVMSSKNFQMEVPC